MCACASPCKRTASPFAATGGWWVHRAAKLHSPVDWPLGLRFQFQPSSITQEDQCYTVLKPESCLWTDRADAPIGHRSFCVLTVFFPLLFPIFQRCAHTYTYSSALKRKSLSQYMMRKEPSSTTLWSKGQEDREKWASSTHYFLCSYLRSLQFQQRKRPPPAAIPAVHPLRRSPVANGAAGISPSTTPSASAHPIASVTPTSSSSATTQHKPPGSSSMTA